MTKKIKNMLTGNLLFTASIATILPADFADQNNFLGYPSICPWAPVSSIILFCLGTARLISMRNKSKEGSDE